MNFCHPSLNHNASEKQKKSREKSRLLQLHLIPFIVVAVGVAIIVAAAASGDVHPEGLERILEDVRDPAFSPGLH